MKFLVVVLLSLSFSASTGSFCNRAYAKDWSLGRIKKNKRQAEALAKKPFTLEMAKKYIAAGIKNYQKFQLIEAAAFAGNVTVLEFLLKEFPNVQEVKTLLSSPDKAKRLKKTVATIDNPWGPGYSRYFDGYFSDFGPGYNYYYTQSSLGNGSDFLSPPEFGGGNDYFNPPGFGIGDDYFLPADGGGFGELPFSPYNLIKDYIEKLKYKDELPIRNKIREIIGDDEN